MRLKIISIIISVMLITPFASAETITFDKDKVGELPPGWAAVVTGEG